MNIQLTNQLKYSIDSLTDIAWGIAEQGRKDGLSNEAVFKSIVMQMDPEDLREICSLARLFYYLLNEFLRQHGDVKHRENINELINKSIETCKEMAQSKKK